MKSLSAAITSHLEQEVTTLAVCWKITLRTGTVLTFTAHDQDVTVGGLTYKSTTGTSSSGIPKDLEMSVDSIDVQSFLDDDYIKESDVLAGVYDHAEVEVFKVNWLSPDDGTIYLQKGYIGDIDIKSGLFVAEVRGRMQMLQKNALKMYSPVCRAKFGDSECGINLASYRVTSSVTTVINSKRFGCASLGVADNYFKRGHVVWSSGSNYGLSSEVTWNINTQFQLSMNPLFPIEAGTTFNIYPGCNKSRGTCRDTYNNIQNMRAEPFIPTMTTTISPRST
jgi:uncharacterized phage protein (TIGR02218 family)